MTVMIRGYGRMLPLSFRNFSAEQMRQIMVRNAKVTTQIYKGMNKRTYDWYARPMQELLLFPLYL